MFLQFHDKLTNWIVEMSGFNQPPQLAAKDFSKRQGMLKQVIKSCPSIPIIAEGRSRSCAVIPSVEKQPTVMKMPRPICE